MPCVDLPSEKSAFQLRLIIPDSLQCAANGVLRGKHPVSGGKTEYRWEENIPLSTYTMGFAVGKFHEYTEPAGNHTLRYLSSTYDTLTMKKIFRETKTMLTFFKEYSGCDLADSVYTQVLVPGWEAQELGSFSIIGDGYAGDALKSEDDLGIFIHEFAHQWWGNMVTCVDWRHFWLNEGMATWMVAKYKGWRFGAASRDTEFADIKAGYEKVLKAGKNKPLVFPDWDHPTRDDRRIVYDKGAYVLQLLEDELGPGIFQEGIQAYTKTYWGKSVTTADFQSAMEKVAKRSLEVFFKKWVYSAVGER
jgi:aminopeptidase N